MASQRISEALADIGSEDAKRSFFREYINSLIDSIPILLLRALRMAY
jgi:hypothetical protein